MTLLYRDAHLCVTAVRVSDPRPDDKETLAEAFGCEYAESLYVRTPERMRESVCAALLLYDTLKLCGFSPSRVIRGRYGRPSFADGGPDFSLSHDGGVAVCSLCTGSTGVDVTQVSRSGRIKSFDDFARRFMSDAEAEELAAAPQDEVQRRFATLWADRESASKLRGGPLADSFGKPIDNGLHFLRFSLSSPAGECRVSVCFEQ